MQFCCRLSPDRKVNIKCLFWVLSLLLLVFVLAGTVAARDYHIQASDGETYTITVGEGTDVEDFSIRKLDGQLLTGVTEEERDIAGELYHAARILWIVRRYYSPETPTEDWVETVRVIGDDAFEKLNLRQLATVVAGHSVSVLTAIATGGTTTAVELTTDVLAEINGAIADHLERRLVLDAYFVALTAASHAVTHENILRGYWTSYETRSIAIPIDELYDALESFYKVGEYLILTNALVQTYLGVPDLKERLIDFFSSIVPIVPKLGTLESIIYSNHHLEEVKNLYENSETEINQSVSTRIEEDKRRSRTLLEEAGFFPPIITPPLPEGTISHQTLTLGGGSQTIDVAPYFSSENNLDYDAVATPSGMVTGTVNGSVITIIPVAAGITTVVVTARDTVTGLTAIQTISVSVRQTGAVIFRPTNTDPTWTPTTISNPRAEGLREGVSVIVDDLSSGKPLNVRTGAGTNYQDIGDVYNRDHGIITDGPRFSGGYTWWEIDWNTKRLDGWSVEVFGGDQLLFRRPPDLEIRDLDVSDRQVSIGEEIELEVEIRNNGPGESAATEVTFYYSDTRHSDLEDLGDESDLRGGWTLHVPALQEDEDITLTRTVDAPTIPDTYYYGALLSNNIHSSDNTDHLDEEAIRNNLAREEQVQVTISPDYIVESISLSGNRTTLDPGGSFTLRATVRNIGLGEPSSSSDLDYYRSSDARISTSDSWVGDDSVSGLDTNETGDESIRLIAPTEPGVYYYGACVSDVSYESDRGNNCSAAIAITVRQVITPVEITGSPDLVVSLSSNYSLVDPNGSINLVATVRNQGDADASNSVTLRYYLSTDTIVSSDDQLIATDSVRSLSRGNSDNEDHGVRAPSQPGIYYYYACVDSVTDEDDTGNNCSNVITINVRGSDLVVESISVDLLGQTGSINPNGEFSLNATIRNQGTGNAAATIARYYISTDQTFSTVDDSEVQTASISAINAGASTNAQSTAIRSPYTSGIFYCFVCVDSFSNEIDTGNNCSDPIKITVRNVAPQPAGTISALNIKMRTTAYFVVSNYFSDENNDTLNYSANSSDNNIVKAGISGTQIVITAIGVGSATITITASDGEFNTTQTFTVSITAPNRAPTAIGTISALTLTVGDSAKQINVSGNFRDPNGDNLEFTAKSDDDNIATASAAGSTVTITPIKAGSATITVTASDGKLTATQTISVSVVESNSAPTAIGTISERTLTIGDSPAEIDVSSNFSDPDNDKLTYIASSNNTGVATVSVSNSKVTITPKGTGSATITVTASDGTLTTTQTISVTVTDKPIANRAPVTVGAISARTLTVGDSSIQIDVSSNFQDPDDDILAYSANLDDDSVATASTSGSTITITPVSAGSATITVTANDGEFTATQTISVTVTAAPVANRAPFTVGAISARILTVGDSSIQIDVSSNFQDPDGDSLTYSADSSNSSVATASTIGSIVTITPVGAGNATITVTASDGSLTATQTFSVSVALATEETWMPDANLREKVRSRLELQSGEPITQQAVQELTWLNANNNQIVNLTGLEYATSLTDLSLTGNQISNLTPINGLTGLNELRLWNNQISDLTPLTGLQIYHLGLSENEVSDLTPLTNLTNLSLLDLSDNEISDITPLANLTRLWYLNLSGNEISDITPLANLTRLSTVEAGKNKALDLSDNQISDITTLSNLTALRGLDLSNNQISSVTPLENLNELVDLFLTGNSITDDTPLRRLQANNQIVRIDILNRAPFTVGTIPNRTFNTNSSAATINITQYFNDRDRDTVLTYNGSSNDTAVADVSVNGSQITITPGSVGSATVTVTVSDGELTATQSFTVTVTADDSIETEEDWMPDEYLRALVQTRLNLASGDALTKQAMPDLTELSDNDISRDDNISDLTGLEYATGLSSISLSDRQHGFSSLSPLAGLTSLTYLELRSDQISDITPIRNLTSLTDLIIDDAQISNISSLQNLTSITKIILSNNQISSISSLENLTSLTWLDMQDNEISNLSPLDELTTLTYLDLSDNQISDISDIEDLTALTHLDLANNQISDVSSLEDLTALKILYLDNNQISDVSSLEDLTALTRLDVEGNSITDYAPLRRLQAKTTQTIYIDVDIGPVANRAPFTVGAISARTLTVGESAIQIDVSSNFQDPDGDTLTFSANSSNSSVATASAIGSIVTITPVGAGTATITVTASDGSLTATQTISVTVSAAPIANRAPFTVGTVSARTLTAGGSATTLNVSSNFQDPDGDTLTYSANSSNNSVATASAAGSQITITPVGAGTATITVTASDGSLTATQTISVTVNAANRAPTAVGSIPAQTLTAGGSALLLTVSGYFNDPDGDTLTYSANSSNNSVATATATGSQITITPIGAGTATITVTASDGSLSVTQTISVTVSAANRAPGTVGSIPAQTLTAGGSALLLTVSGYFNDPDSDTLTYSANSSNSSVATASASGSRVLINAVAVGTVTIKVTASDGSLSVTQTISVTVNAAVTEETWMPDANLRAAVRSALGLQEGDALTQQALQGITRLSAHVSAISDISGLEYATQLQVLGLMSNQISDISALSGLTSLTILELRSNSISDISALSELTSLTSLNLNHNSISDISALSELTSLTSLNLSGNFISDISVLSELTSLTTLGLGGNSISDISVFSELTSLTGLGLSGNSFSDISVLSELTSLTSLGLEDNSISDISVLSELTSLTGLSLSSNSISDISALSGLTSLQYIYLYENSISDISALSELTSLQYISLSHNSISDISALSELTSLIELELYDNSISDISALSELTSLQYINLGDNSISDVSPLEALTSLEKLQLFGNPISDYGPLRRLVAAIEADGRILTLDITIPPAAPARTTPTQTSLLSNYPNPFNPETWIPYQLSKPADVTLTFYNVQGVMVRQLALGHQSAGVYYSRSRAAHWDGKNNLGEKVAAGIYFVKFKAGNYTKIRKMLIRK